VREASTSGGLQVIRGVVGNYPERATKLHETKKKSKGTTRKRPGRGNRKRPDSGGVGKRTSS